VDRLALHTGIADKAAMEKKQMILAYEQGFAARLASRILSKPRLSAWMIFIPFIFIFYFQDFSKYKKQRKTFMDNWLMSRKRMLNEAFDALGENRSPDIDSLLKVADLPEKAKESYKNLLTVLSGHYTRLLRAGGDDYPALVRSAYSKKKGDYLFFINQLSDTEKALNKALTPQLKKENLEVSQTISKIEAQTDRIRRQETEQFF
jgi:hypothetical protein